MPATSSAPSSLKDYLKKYESVNEQEKKKKRKKKEKKTKPAASGVLLVDEDPVWQKPVNLEEESEQSADEDTPQVDEDIEVKRMRRLEQLREQRKDKPISEDGSGWISLSANDAKAFNQNADIYSASTKSARNDTPSPERQLEPFITDIRDTDLSPPRQRQRCLDTPPEHDADILHLPDTTSDLSPPRKRRIRDDTPSPKTEMKSSISGRKYSDLSPPRRRQRDSSIAQSPGTRRGHLLSESRDSDMSPPRKPKVRNDTPSPARDDYDLSPPRQRRRRNDTPSEGNIRRRNDSPSEGNIRKNYGVSDLSPPGRSRQSSPHQDYQHASMGTDLSPPRKDRSHSIKDNTSHADLSPPRRKHDERSHQSSLRERPKTGLISGRDIREEIVKIKKDEHLRIQEMDPSMSGRGAEPVYRDKKGERISKEEYFKLKKKVEEKPKEKKIEWGKGLAQKREAEARLQELEMEKDKPFARTRDDPELDKMLKERLRWGDPMAHLVKKKHSEPVLPDLGESEKMIESGFLIPQDIPSHSWLKRGLDAAPNRYGIKPGRHWDGVDRSNGFEKDMFKKLNEKQATQREAYLWSVSDM